MDNNNFGTLLIYDLKDIKGNTTDKSYLKDFIEKLVDIMDMTIIGTPQFEYFPYNAYNVERGLVGYSITAIISLSSITIHICDIQKTAYIDCFTCCRVDNDIKNKINHLINEFFNPDEIYTKEIKRGL